MKHSVNLKSLLGWAMVLSILSIQLICLEQVKATDYYFSTVRGNDGNSGTSPNSPWLTISKMQSIVNGLQPGDVIYLERGSVWYQAQLNFLYRKGTASNPIRIRPYGTGAMPVLSGEKVLSGGSESNGVHTFYDSDIPGAHLTSASYGRRYLGSVTIGGKRYATARYPNGDNYLMSTGTGSTTLTGDETWQTNQWQDGFVAVKNVKWQWSSAYIYSNTSNTLNTSPHITTNGGIGTPHGEKYYYFLNAPAAMDIKGEWASKANQISILWPGNIDEVRVSVKDTIINIYESDHIHFDSVEIRGANFFGAFVRQSDYNKFNRCKFSGIGEFGVYMYGVLELPPDPGDTEGGEVTNCEFEDVLLASVFYRFCRGGIIKGNYIHRNGLNNGYYNLIEEVEPSPVHGYSIAVLNSLGGNPLVARNYIDSTAAGIITHFNRYSINIRENYIKNYGLSEISDAAGFYLVADTYSSAIKSVKKNFFVNAHAPKGSMYDPWTDSYIHSVYFDQDSYSVKGDSNSIENTSAALCTNGGKYRSFKYNNILNPNMHNMHYSHGNAIYHSYNIPLANGTKAQNDTIVGNNIVFGSISCRGYSFWRKADEYGSQFPINGRIDDNHYFDPYNNSSTIAIIFNQYTPSASYNLQEWQNASFSSGGMTYDPAKQSTYDNTPYATVKLFKNFSAEDKSFPLQAKYVNVYGEVVEGSVVVPAFYSVLLFNTEGDASLDNDTYLDSTLVPAIRQGVWEEPEPQNIPPSVFGAQFTIEEQDNIPLTIGTITATDPDADQKLTYSIVSGNSSGLFTINGAGVLSFATSAIDFSGSPSYNLTIRVQDNGSPALFDEADVLVSLVESVQEVQNHTPVIQPQTFLTSFDESLQTVIGYIEASDPDEGQNLSYSIVSGNSEGLFSLEEWSGELILEDLPDNQTPVTYQLLVRVSDDAAEPLFSEAAITVYIASSTNVYYIDPDNYGSENADGSYENPFWSWSQVTWEEEASYLQKRGTVANEDKILITARGVTLGEYGSGNKPIINSVADDYAIKAMDKDNITIKNLKVNADQAIGAVYFIGASCINNTIENCELIGSDYGIRIIDGSSYTVKYNVFMNDVDGIYSIADDAEIYYNIFKSNHKAVNLSSYSSSARIYNNVFYDNRQGISASYAEVTLFNNIFYLTQAGDQAINHKLDKLVSNNNIFFPEQTGFIEIEETQYNTLEDYQQSMGFDMNSFAQDPLFLDAYSNNFTVAEESRAIDAGRTVGLTQDFYGKAVPYGGGPDIGMSEAPTEAVATAVSYFNNDGDEKLLLVYPNPSAGRFNIEFESKDSDHTELFVNSLSGRQVYFTTIDVNGRFVTEVDLTDLPGGMYFVSAKSADEILTQRVIIQ